MSQSRPLSTTPETSHRKLTIVFDIDDVLAGHNSIEEVEKLYYLRKSALIVAAQHEHQVLVGVIELMQWLFSKPYVVVAFFSSGAKERNDEFVEKLLTLALGKERFLSVAPSLRVLSKADCTKDNNEHANHMYTTYGLHTGNFKKDIRKALSEGADLESTIFIDDDSSYIYYQQAKNFLRSPWGHSEDLRFMQTLVENNSKYLKEHLAERFPRHNSVFYLAGVLGECLNVHENGGKVTDFLFDLHFQKAERQLFGFEPKRLDEEDTHFHQLGLEHLKTVNPNLTFVTAEDYMAVTSAPATEAEQAELLQLQSANVDNCCVM